MIPEHLAEWSKPTGIMDDPHPRLKTIELLNYIRYLAEPRVGNFNMEGWEGEMARIHSTANAAIRMLGSQPGPTGTPAVDASQ